MCVCKYIKYHFYFNACTYLCIYRFTSFTFLIWHLKRRDLILISLLLCVWWVENLYYNFYKYFVLSESRVGFKRSQVIPVVYMCFNLLCPERNFCWPILSEVCWLSGAVIVFVTFHNLPYSCPLPLIVSREVHSWKKRSQLIIVIIWSFYSYTYMQGSDVSTGCGCLGQPSAHSFVINVVHCLLLVFIHSLLWVYLRISYATYASSNTGVYVCLCTCMPTHTYTVCS